jgi:DNA-directed RNA polymerase subunit M/transcription elongation factor TFIIS
MKFCPKCENVLVIKRIKKGKEAGQKQMECAACGYSEPFDENARESYTIRAPIKKTGKEKTLVIASAKVEEPGMTTEEFRESNEWQFGKDDFELG